MIDKKKSEHLFAGAVALIFFSCILVGIDYKETRSRAADVPLNTHRIDSMEAVMKSGAKEQKEATKELANAVVSLREVIAEMRGEMD